MFHLIDSDRAVLDVTSEIIASAGFESLKFSSSAAYLEYVNSSAYAPAIAMITCYIMPDLDGYGLIKAVREKYPQQRAVIISGSPTNDIPSDEENLLCLHLCKPYDAQTLVDALKKLNLCDDTCSRKGMDVGFSQTCKFGLQNHCPFYTDSCIS